MTMESFSTGDFFFIVIIFGVIHGIMLAIGQVRRIKTKRNSKAESG